MPEFTYTAIESHELADAFYKAIKECPFERNKDLSNWTDAAILYAVVIKQSRNQIPEGAKIINKVIKIQDPDLTVSDDTNSYLVIDLVIEYDAEDGHPERAGITYKFPVDY